MKRIAFLLSIVFISSGISAFAKGQIPDASIHAAVGRQVG
jgi:hypothetical protein